MTIGEFAARTRLSPKALRLYNELGLLSPAQIDPNSGYRLYAENQVETAQLVGLLRRLDMPLAEIAAVLPLSGREAATAVLKWWEQAEIKLTERRALVTYLQTYLNKEDHAMYDIKVRTIPRRNVASISRYLHLGETDRFFNDAFARLRAVWRGLGGNRGMPLSGVLRRGERRQRRSTGTVPPDQQ